MSSKREQELERVGIDEPDAPRKVAKNEVSLQNANDACWLVKIVPSVWNAWENLEQGDDVGQLVVRTVRRKRPDNTTVEEETMHIKTGGMQTKFKDGVKTKLPDYKLTGQREIADALAFTRPPTGTIGPASIAATIKRQYLMQPQLGSTYERMNKHRLVSHTIKERTTEAVSMTEVHKAARQNMARKGTAFDAAFHQAQQAKLESKGEANRGTREKMDPKELRSKLFGLFSKKAYYPFKELNRELQQPEKYLREALAEIARMHTSGQNRNSWELKPEFKADRGDESGEDEDQQSA